MTWIECVVDTNYQIWSEHPYPIQKKGKSRIVSEWLNPDGYYSVKLSRLNYLKHRIISLQFIPNPKKLTIIDHIKMIKTDNRVENLRWISISDNAKNRNSSRGIPCSYISVLPEQSFELKKYGNHTLCDGYFLSFENGIVVICSKTSDDQYRIHSMNTDKRSGWDFFSVGNSEGRILKVAYSKIKLHAEDMIEQLHNEQV